MQFRRRVTQRVAVIEGDTLDDPNLSAAALGILAFISAPPAGECDVDTLCSRFSIDASALALLVDELRAGGHLADVELVPPVPPARRQHRPTRRKPWLPATSKLLLRMIADRADDDGFARTTNAELAEVTGNRERTIKRNLKILEDAGLVSREMVDRGEPGLARVIRIQGGQTEPEAQA